MNRTFASIAEEAETAATGTGLAIQYLTISSLSGSVGIHGRGQFTHDEAMALAAALGGQGPVYHPSPASDSCHAFGTIIATTEDLRLEVFCEYVEPPHSHAEWTECPHGPGDCCSACHVDAEADE